MTIYKLFFIIGSISLVLTILRYLFQDYRKVILSFMQNFIGTLFMFSGFVKAVDPMGTSIKMHEYFEAMHLEFFNPLSTPLTVAMLVMELTLAVAILIGFKPKITTSLLLLLNVFFMFLTGFTFLSGYEPTHTFYGVSILSLLLICAGAIIENGALRFWMLVSGFFIVFVTLIMTKYGVVMFAHGFEITKMKVTDCGCFGDFMKLKPWQTFYKDVLLSFMVLILTLRYKNIKPAVDVLWRNVLTYAMLVISFFFCLYNFVWNEPVLDFRPYAIGSDINLNSTVIKPEKKDMIFVYKNKKTGVTQEFKMSEVCDANCVVVKHSDEWDFVVRRDSIIDEGIPARITNLHIYNQDKDEITDSILHDPNYALMVVAPHLDITHVAAFTEKLNPLAQECDKAHIKFFVVTNDEAEAFRHKNQTAYPFFSADETPLKTMMRSNPGLMLLKNGMVINKWHYRHLPTFADLNSEYFSKK